MRIADSRTLMLALRAWLDEDERNASQIAEYVIERAIAGHIGYFRFVIDTIDGPIRLSREDETTGEVDWVQVVADDEPEAGTIKAA